MSDSTPDWGAIQVRGARENNLRDISLDIPKRQLTVFTGVSGSGKSSLVFETIAAESRRLINETYTAFLQGFMATPSRPDVDSLENLTAAIIVDQERMGANARSTVGTATDAYDMLRVIFSRLGQPLHRSVQRVQLQRPGRNDQRRDHAREGEVARPSRARSRSPAACAPSARGLGAYRPSTSTRSWTESKSLNEGAITFPGFQPGTWYHRIYTDSGFFDPDKPLRDFTDAEWSASSTARRRRSSSTSFNLTYTGLVDKIRKSYLVKDADSLQAERAGSRRADLDLDVPARPAAARG